MYKFRKLMPTDFPVMLKWLQKPHVKEWWNDGDDTLEKVARHYGENSDTNRFILVEETKDDKKNIGYFQYYFASNDAIGIDQFIGEKEYLNCGVGEKAVRTFIELIERQHNPKKIILDPSPTNKRAIRCYEKVGFKYFETVKNENGDAAYMMHFETTNEFMQNE